MKMSELARHCRRAWAGLRLHAGRVRAIGAALALSVGVFAVPAMAQNATSVTITGANPASFSGAGQLITFNVALYAGNVEVTGLTFTSGNPAGKRALSHAN